MTGHPALSINAGFSDDLSVGMMIVGRKFDEATFLTVAYAHEKITDASMFKENATIFFIFVWLSQKNNS